jgi:hypothetical protein
MGPEGKSRNHTSVAQVPQRTSLCPKASPHRANGKSLRHAAMAAPPFREFHRVAVRIMGTHRALPRLFVRRLEELHAARFQLFVERIEMVGGQLDMNASALRRCRNR